MNDSGQAHESPGAMERGFVEPTDLPGVPHTPPSQGSRQLQHSGQGSKRGTGRPGNARNQTGQDNPFQAATGTQGSHVHAAHGSNNNSTRVLVWDLQFKNMCGHKCSQGVENKCLRRCKTMEKQRHGKLLSRTCRNNQNSCYFSPGD